ncbi:MAG: hypothetical protein CL388_04275 [Acidiferrobacteraceae bacterium]|nr:hypothetical protein [Acidiferrobacteraceae bacterium]
MMMSSCHCSMCRKTHGTAYGCFIGVSAEAFEWRSAEGKNARSNRPREGTTHSARDAVP